MFSCKLPIRFFDVFCMLDACGSVLAADESGQLVLYDPKDGYNLIKSERAKFGNPQVAYDFVESLVFPERSCVSGD